MKQIKKILMISFGAPFSGPHTGGTKRFCELVNYYQDNSKYDITLCSTDNSTDLPNNLKHIKLSSDTIISGFMPPTYYIYKQNKTLLNEIKMEYSYIIAFEATIIFWLCLLNYKNLVMMVRKDLIAYKSIEMNSDNSKRINKTIILNLYKIAERISLIKSRIRIVQCSYDRNQLIHRHRWFSFIFKDKIYVQINNINPNWIVNNSTCEVDIKINEPSNSLKICYIGNFENERKGYKLLLEALELLQKHQFDLQIYFVGNGKNIEEIKEKYSTYKNYHFCGYVDNPIKILKTCNLLVVPSLADSFPNTVMEGIYNGIPVIASNVGGIPEIINDEDAIFNPDVKSLYTKLLKITDGDYLDILKNKQFERKNELIFDWSEKIAYLIDEKMKDCKIC